MTFKISQPTKQCQPSSNKEHHICMTLLIKVNNSYMLKLNNPVSDDIWYVWWCVFWKFNVQCLITQDNMPHNLRTNVLVSTYDCLQWLILYTILTGSHFRISYEVGGISWFYKVFLEEKKRVYRALMSQEGDWKILQIPTI